MLVGSQRCYLGIAEIEQIRARRQVARQFGSEELFEPDLRCRCRALVQRIQGAGVHLRRDVVEVLEHEVQGADRVADALDDLTSCHGARAFLVEDGLGGGEGKLA